MLRDRDWSILEDELIADGPTLRSLSEAELHSIGISPARERQALFLQRKQQAARMQRLIEGLLDERAMLEEIVQLVWERQFRSKLADFEAHLREWHAN